MFHRRSSGSGVHGTAAHHRQIGGYFDGCEHAIGSRSAVIDVVGQVKGFGRTMALNGLNLNVVAGEVHGFLGPNGAGKTTTLRILLGLLKADSGALHLLGRDPWLDAVELHVIWPMYRATGLCGPRSPAAR